MSMPNNIFVDFCNYINDNYTNKNDFGFLLGGWRIFGNQDVITSEQVVEQFIKKYSMPNQIDLKNGLNKENKNLYKDEKYPDWYKKDSPLSFERQKEKYELRIKFQSKVDKIMEILDESTSFSALNILNECAKKINNNSVYNHKNKE